jgi:hypothetical protein
MKPLAVTDQHLLRAVRAQGPHTSVFKKPGDTKRFAFLFGKARFRIDLTLENNPEKEISEIS